MDATFITSILRGSLGVFVLLAVCYLLSNNRKAIDWKLVASGVGLQLLLAILILKVDFVRAIFQYIANFFVLVLDFTKKGSEFIFGGLMNASDSFGYIFAFQVLPTILFFAALSAVLYYLGILQRIIFGFAWIMSKIMRLSGAESIAAAANVFIGQTEAPLVIKPYLEGMTKSEINCLMTGGMATIAGGVFAAFVGFLGGDNPEMQLIFATHLLTASIISAPAAIVAAKMLVPEVNRDAINTNLEVPKDKLGSNLLDAISIGTTDGLKLAVNVGAMLLVFIALVAMLNYILSSIGGMVGLNPLIEEWTNGQYKGFSLEYILGMLFSPIAWLIGVPYEDITKVGQLLGKKTVINEFVAYADLSGIKDQLSEKSVIISTYALCGFANFSSIGIQIGGIGSLAPGQRENLTKLGIKALIGGTIACFLTASIAGMFV